MTAAAVLYVKDLGLMRAFYETCFGLSALESGGDDFCVLASADWDLSLVTMPAAIVITVPPGRREDSPVKLSFEVASIEELYAVITGTGGQVDPLEPAWEFRGHWHVDCLDPEGNVVQLRQPVTAGQAG